MATIDLDSKKLSNLASEVLKFSQNVRFACDDIKLATNKLSQTTDAQTIADIEVLTKNIVRIIDLSEPTLNDLSQKAQAYAYLAEHLQKTANGG